MVDNRFFSKATPISLADIARRTASTLKAADTTMLIHSVAPLDTAGIGDISFLDNTKYLDSFARSKASACFVRSKFAHRAPEGMALLVNDQPYASFAEISAALYPSTRPAATIHPQAVVAQSATIGQRVTLGAGVIIGDKAEIGDDVVIGANTVIGDGVIIGRDTQIGALCSLSHTLIGKHVILHRSVHIGQDGFGFAPTPRGLLKVPQLGRVVIGDHVEIGSNSCIDRGAGPDTMIGNGTKIDNLVQIGHNVVIGQHCVIVSQCGIAGSVTIGDGVMLGGQVGVSGHLTIGNGARVAAQSGIIADIPPGATYGGYPAVPVRDWHRQTVALSRLIKHTTNHEED